MNLNKITYNEDLTILNKTEQPIRAYAQQANTIEVLAPVSGFNVAYMVIQGLANGVVNPRLRATQRLFMSPLSASGNYSRWNLVIPGAILNDMSLMNSTGVRVRAEFWYITGDCLGVEKYDTEVGIADLLAADYPSATDGQFVRVIDTNTDWYYDDATSAWVDYEDTYQVGVSVEPTSAVDFTLEKGIYADAPSHAPTNTELILQELAAKLGLIGGTMTGDIDMDDNDILNAKTVTFYNALGTAVLSYDGTNLILNRNAVDEEVLTVLNELGDLSNVLDTASTTDDILVYDAVDSRWEVTTKTAFLAAIQSTVNTNSNDIDNLETNKENVSNKATGFAVVNDTLYPTVEAVKEQLDLKESLANKGATNGYAPLVGGVIPAAYVPNAYDDFAVYDTKALLEAETELSTAVLYIVTADETSDDNTSTYRWTGSVFVKIHDQLSASEVKTLYESNADTNAYTDTEKSHLGALPADAYSKAETADGTIPIVKATTHVDTPKVNLATGVYIQYNAVDDSIDFVIE